MKSMTGHGRGESVRGGQRLAIELSSVNRKQAEIVINLPRAWHILESAVRDEIQKLVARGRVQVTVDLENAKSETHGLNVKAAQIYLAELKTLQKALKLKGEISLETVLRGHGVLRESNELPDPEDIWPGLKEALLKALKQLVLMREREGQALAKDLTTRLKSLQTHVKKIHELAPNVQHHYRENLIERLKHAGFETTLEDERLLKEVALFADRCDITEELTRLQSHFEQFHALLKKSEAIGRTLDFLLQEMNREVNTLGNKGNDLTISRLVVEMKTELEKMREQVQNVE
jgi:uncharacterized protein (TIGR00255 family)